MLMSNHRYARINLTVGLKLVLSAAVEVGMLAAAVLARVVTAVAVVVAYLMMTTRLHPTQVAAVAASAARYASRTMVNPTWQVWMPTT